MGRGLQCGESSLHQQGEGTGSQLTKKLRFLEASNILQHIKIFISLD